MMYHMKKISLTQGRSALVDDEDYPELSGYHWVLQGRPDGRAHCFRNTKQIGPLRRRRIYMHQHIFGVCGRRGGVVVDHINGDGLDNRRSNLRVATWAQNLWNSRCRSQISGYRGVYPSRGTSASWWVQFQSGGVLYYLGCFHDPIEAALAYDNAVIGLRGEFAKTNFLTYRGGV